MRGAPMHDADGFFSTAHSEVAFWPLYLQFCFAELWLNSAGFEPGEDTGKSWHCGKRPDELVLETGGESWERAGPEVCWKFINSQEQADGLALKGRESAIFMLTSCSVATKV